MSDTAAMNIYQRLNLVRSKVAYIKKDKAVENYKAVTHDAVTAETRKWFIEAGILIVPTEMESSMVDTGAKTSKGNAIYRFEARYRIDFVNIDDPAQVVPVTLTAHANDHGDKAPGKTVSYATKYAILKVLQLETGENEEARQTRTLAPGDEVEEDELQELLGTIRDAKTMDELQKAFAKAYTRASKDREAQGTLLRAKDERKAELGRQK